MLKVLQSADLSLLPPPPPPPAPFFCRKGHYQHRCTARWGALDISTALDRERTHRSMLLFLRKPKLCFLCCCFSICVSVSGFYRISELFVTIACAELKGDPGRFVRCQLNSTSSILYLDDPNMCGQGAQKYKL